MFCLGLTTFQPGDVGVEASDVGVVDAGVELPLEGGRERDDGEVLKVDVAVDDSGLLLEDVGGAVVDGASKDEVSDRGETTLELRTTWLAPSCMPSLVARVTSMKSEA